jgi:nicotinate-nucleotide adenylyltransferase
MPTLGATRLGVFGGTFNPIHLGHLHLARRTKKLFRLDRILFVVATAPPHKAREELVPFVHRYAMVSLATAGTASFIPSLAELDPPASPFSLHTMEKLAHVQGDRNASLYFIAGGDSLLEVMGWHQGEELLRSYNFIFVARPGIVARNTVDLFPAGIRERILDLRILEANQLAARIRRESHSGATRIFIIDAGAPDISSSMARNLAAAGKPIRHLVPAAVHQYIHKLHLYGER